MPTPAQKTAIQNAVAKVRAKNSANNAVVTPPTTQVVANNPQALGEAVKAAQVPAVAPVVNKALPPRVEATDATKAVVSPVAPKENTFPKEETTVALPKIDAPTNINPTTGEMTNADGSPYVPGPNSTINPNNSTANPPVQATKTEDQKMVFGDAAMAQNQLDPNFITNRDTTIANELSAKNKYGDFSDAQMKKSITDELAAKGADVSDPRMAQTVERIAAGIRAQQPAKTSDDYYNTLASGGTLPNQDVSNPNAQYAMNLFKQVQSFAVKTPQQISGDLTSGKLLVGSNLYNKLVQAGHGEKLQMAKSLKSMSFKQEVNNFVIGAAGADKDKSYSSQQTTFPTHPNYEESISAEYATKPKSYVDMFREHIANNTELQDAKTQARATLDQINEKRRTLSNFADDIKQTIIAGGGTVSQGYLAMLAQEKSKPIVREIESLQDQYASESAQVKDLTDTSNMEFQLEMKQYSDDRDIALESMRNKRDRDQKIQMMGIQDEYTQQAEKRSFDYGQKAADLGFQRDVKKMDIQDKYGQAQEGRQYTRQLELNNINYKQDLNKIAIGQQNDIQKIQLGNKFDIEKMGLSAYYDQQKEQYKYDLEHQEEISSQIGPVGQEEIDGARAELGYAPGWDNPQIAKLCSPDGIQGGQCAKYVNNIYSAAGAKRPFSGSDQSIQGKINVTKSKERGSPMPVIGGAVVSDNFYKDPKTGINYGHVETIIAIDPKTGMLTVSGSNLRNDEKTYTRQIGANEGFVRGFTKAPGAEVRKTVKPLTDKNYTQYNQALTGFRGNKVVKDYEDAISSSADLLSSLKDKSGPGDVAGIFQFMRTLDPNSVVRESEFQVAASTAGVKDQIGNAFRRISNGQRLSETQRKAFGTLAKTYIKNKGKSYDRIYDDLVRQLDAGGVDQSFIPTRATKTLDDLWNDSDSDLTNPYE